MSPAAAAAIFAVVEQRRESGTRATAATIFAVVEQRRQCLCPAAAAAILRRESSTWGKDPRRAAPGAKIPEDMMMFD